MGKHHKSAFSTSSAQITSTISVSLVLFILGIVALLGLIANNVTTSIKENIGFVTELDYEISQSDIDALNQQWDKAPYIASKKFISAEEVLQQELKLSDDDILKLLDGANPYPAEFEIKVKAEYANRDSLEKIEASLANTKGINKIHTNNAMVDDINVGVNNVILALLVIAIALILISFVLINNSVRLAIYSKRFTIHTMRLVGATNGFIRRPFILNNMLHGFLAAVVTSAILSGILYYLRSIEYSLSNAISWIEACYVFAALAIVGIVLCSTAALFATNKYLRTSYDDMF